MSISDVQNELNLLKPNIIGENSTIENADVLLETKIQKFENFMDTKVINMFSRPWSKLEIKLKKKKIVEYFEGLLVKETITTKECTENVDKFSKELDLNRKIKVKYDIEECCITEIK